MGNVDIKDYEAVVSEQVKRESVSEDDNTGRAVRIVWVDSGLACSTRWQSMDELPQNVETVETVALWMGQNDDVVMVGSTRDMSNSNWLGVQLIWRPSIMRKEWL